MNMTMIRWWFKPNEKLPAHKEQVLVRYNETIELAYFDSEQRLFLLKDGTKTYRMDDNIEWMETLRSEGL